MKKEFHELSEEEKTKAYTYWFEDMETHFADVVCTNLNGNLKESVEKQAEEETGLKIAVDNFKVVNGEIHVIAKNAHPKALKNIYKQIEELMDYEKSFENFEDWAEDRQFEDGMEVCI